MSMLVWLISINSLNAIGHVRDHSYMNLFVAVRRCLYRSCITDRAVLVCYWVMASSKRYTAAEALLLLDDSNEEHDSSSESDISDDPEFPFPSYLDSDKSDSDKSDREEPSNSGSESGSISTQ